MKNRKKDNVLPAVRKITIRHTIIRETNGEEVREDVKFRYEITEDLMEDWDAAKFPRDVLDILYTHERIERNAVNRDEYHRVTEYREGYSELAMHEDADGIFQQVVRRTETQRLIKALETVSEKQRKRLILYYVHGFSFREIARMEGVSQQCVRRSVQGAKKKIMNNM